MSTEHTNNRQEVLWITGYPKIWIDKIADHLSLDPPSITRDLLRLQKSLMGQQGDTTIQALEQSDGSDSCLPTENLFAEISYRLQNRVSSTTDIPCISDHRLPFCYDRLQSRIGGYHLLFWISPLAALLNDQTPDTNEKPSSVESALTTWRDYHQTLMELYWAQPDTTLLVRLDGFSTESGNRLLHHIDKLCAGQLPSGVKNFFENESVYREFDALLSNSHDRTLATTLAEGFPEVHDLFLELEACTQLLGREAELGTDIIDIKELSQLALNSQVSAHLLTKEREITQNILLEKDEQLKASHDQLQKNERQLSETHTLLNNTESELQRTTNDRDTLDKEVTATRRKVQTLEQERESLKVQILEHEQESLKIQILEQERESLKSEVDNQQAKYQKELDSCKSQLNEFTEEVDLLLLQLHQVQEELAKYYDQYQQALKLLEEFSQTQTTTRHLVSNLIKEGSLDNFYHGVPEKNI